MIRRTVGHTLQMSLRRAGLMTGGVDVVDRNVATETHHERTHQNLARRKVVCVGFMTPPVDGQRIITERMFDRIAQSSPVRQLNLDRFRGWGRLSKAISAAAICFDLASARLRGYSCLYLAPHSGTGLIYSCWLVLASRLLGYGLFVHYHSYKNLASYSRLMRIFLELCGMDATHIVLAPPMARDMGLLYGERRRITVLTNAVFMPVYPPRHAKSSRPLRVGHLSNLSKSKGVVAVVECMRRLAASSPSVEFVLAGPADDAETETLLSEAIVQLGDQLTYLGRVDGADVQAFYREIDVFLFPSLYKHEAEPLVLIESLAAGVPVLATDRGCISYLLGPECGQVLEADQFVTQAVEQIILWSENPAELARASASARARFLELSRLADPHLERLIASISFGTPH